MVSAVAGTFANLSRVFGVWCVRDLYHKTNAAASVLCGISADFWIRLFFDTHTNSNATLNASSLRQTPGCHPVQYNTN